MACFGELRERSFEALGKYRNPGLITNYYDLHRPATGGRPSAALSYCAHVVLLWKGILARPTPKTQAGQQNRIHNDLYY